MKRVLRLALLLTLCVGLCGCQSWMDESYHSVTPHMQEYQNQKQEQIKITNYRELREAMSDLVENAASSAVIYTEGLEEFKVENYVRSAISYLHNYNAIGAYALDEIRYDVGTNSGLPAIALRFNYSHSRSEILRIKQVQTMDQAKRLITAALDDCSAGVVVYVDNYEDVDLTQMIHDYVDNTPWKCMEMPQVVEGIYPNSGSDRLIELQFSYQTSRDKLRTMQETVKPVFTSAELYVRGDGEKWEKYMQLYSFLMERYDYTIETSITPAYSLLRHGVGDSKAFATVYAAMCHQAGLDCRVVSGTKEGEPWSWNVICDEDQNYHVDLLRCKAEENFLPREDGQMDGYVWDYSAYSPSEETAGEQE